MRVRKNRKNLREALIVGAGAGSFKASLKGGQHIMGYRGFNESETKELSWDDFSDPVTDRIEKEFLPANGEGDSMMSQAVTATTKLIYKWFNDGDVFDNTFGLQGWANDLSDYANWLDENIPEAAAILSRIKAVGSDENAYTQLLFDLIHAVFNDEMIVKYADKPVVGTIYDCSGPYSFYTAPTCPECGQECDDWDYQHYGMCSDCYNQQWEESEEEEEYDESVKNRRKRVTESRKRYLKESEDDDEDEDEESGFVRDFVDELNADNELTDEIYKQVTEGRNYTDYQLELVDDAIRHFIDDWRNDSGDIEAETAEEAKQIILDSIGDYLEPNLPEESEEEDDKKASIKNWDKKDQETYRAALKELEKDHELTKSEKKFIKETCYYIYSSLGRQLTDEELKLYCEFASGYDMSVLKDEDWTTKEWAESFVKDDLDDEDEESYEFFTSHGYPDPFYAGKEAYKGKDSIYRNPYKKGSWAHGQYVAGYTSAALDNGDKRFFEGSINRKRILR